MAFRWRPVEGASGYRLVVRDLDSAEVEDQRLPAGVLFRQLDVTAGHRYLWHITALAGTNASASAASQTRYFTVAIRPIYPVISSVLPNPVPAQDGAQAVIVNGKEFRRGCTVVLRDKSSGERFDNFRQLVRRISQLVINPNFTKAEASWTVEVLNPGGFSSGEFRFDVVAPERFARWRWWRSGWPWALGFLAIAAGSFIWLWRQRRQSVREIGLARDQARRQEHERLSRDLHDSLNGLNQINLLSGKLKVMAETGKPATEIREAAGKLSSAVIEAVNSAEDLMWSNRQENDNLENLAAHLRQKFGRFREFNPDLHCELDFPLDLPRRSVSAAINENLLRSASEALRNIVKHAAATQVRCQFVLEDDHLRLTVSDNGQGFRQESNRPVGHGLSNLRRRAEALGGSFTLHSTLGSGTRLTVEIPLTSPSSPATGDTGQPENLSTSPHGCRSQT